MKEYKKDECEKKILFSFVEFFFVLDFEIAIDGILNLLNLAS